MNLFKNYISKTLRIIIPYTMIFVLSFGFIGCSDDTPDCEFVGKWCLSVLGECIEPSSNILSIEFRSNGDHLSYAGTEAGKWTSEDCTVIQIVSATGMGISEYEVESIDGDIMTLNPLGTFIRQD